MSWRRNEQATGRSFASANRAMSWQAASLHPPPPTSIIGRCGRGEETAHFGEVGRTGMSAHRVVGAGDLGGAPVTQHVLGERQYDRAGPAGGRHLERLVDELGDAFGHVDLRHPLCERGEHASEIDLLKGFAVDLVARHLADQDDHRRRILKRRVDADRGVARARPARHQQHPRLAGELAVGLGHERGTAFLAARHEADFGRVVEPVEHFEIAFPGDAKRHVDPMGAQCGNHELAAAEGREIRRHEPTLGADDQGAILSRSAARTEEASPPRDAAPGRRL